MNKQAEALGVAGHSALLDLQADMGQFEWLSSLMWVIKREAQANGPRSMDVIQNLADIGNYLADERAGTLEDICKRLEDDLDAVGGAQ
ncbi:hypothetical protein ACK9U2_000937 [Pseudomonas putida]|uniref:hypothetical protein n=1 Tax=Pseudomonas shirazica TaxID=1940636 RepID=UPI00352478C3